ncbi:MAG: hypothetical protein HDT47_04865 [Ruminococcaceae bacterium]|nr:hypothetical protein [Oscillospiraceae bacterium]
MLPTVQTAPNSYTNNAKKLFIVAEGFEKRSLYWIGKEGNITRFEKSLICRYNPSKQSLFDEMLKEVKKHTTNEPIIIDYNRFEPTIFEHNFKKFISEITLYDEIIIDISVMSKLLIMIIICSLKEFNGKITIIYSEPDNWGPTQQKFQDTILNKTYGTCIGLSSVGVGNVVRTPLLSSVVMQDCPILLIAFLSFNEQLINVLINEISPTRLQIINHKCDRAKWREDAMILIHKDIVEDYKNNKAMNFIESYDLIDYISVFEHLTKIYNENCYNYRIVVSPTGCKIHTVACAILKLCCSDVHIEYPTPESYLFEEYSSDNIIKVHEIIFDSFKETINKLSKKYLLN